jgi:hypothetical protein
MEITLEEQRILELRATYSAEQIRGLALNKRVDAFGQMAKLFQRPKPEEIDIITTQKRYEPFWFARGAARYSYDRRHVYRVPVGPEVSSVTFLGKDFTAPDDARGAFELDAVDHCLEEVQRDLILDAVRGEDAVELRKYLSYETVPVDNLALLERDETLVVPPAVRGSFVVRKLISALIKTIQADVVHDERIDVQEVTLFYRPVYAVEYFWKTKDKRQVMEFDALTGDMRTDSAQIKKRTTQTLEGEALFDIGGGLEKFTIEIDRAKVVQQAAEITDSDYFRQLQAKVKDLRSS